MTDPISEAYERGILDGYQRFARHIAAQPWTDNKVTMRYAAYRLHIMAVGLANPGVTLPGDPPEEWGRGTI